jgi:hypothetical protein
VFNFVLSRRLNLTLYLMQDMSTCNIRQILRTCPMSYLACPCPGHVVDRRSWLQACSARLHTIGLQLCRHGTRYMGARLPIPSINFHCILTMFLKNFYRRSEIQRSPTGQLSSLVRLQLRTQWSRRPTDGQTDKRYKRF